VERGAWDAGLDEALIGGREKPRIAIADYDPRWPARFDRERARIREALGAAAIAIEHIGSTAVPGLAAKPIVDVLVVVDDPDDDAAIVPAMEAVGYELRVREPGHRMLRTPARDANIHFWSAASGEVERYLDFRDQLRRSADDRLAYERLKRELATLEWEDMNEYAYAKGGLIETILSRGAK
jgi:GrpB-like predicted nucleotidyltransferase (UPF0157 family)